MSQSKLNLFSLSENVRTSHPVQFLDETNGLTAVIMRDGSIQMIDFA